MTRRPSLTPSASHCSHAMLKSATSGLSLFMTRTTCSAVHYSAVQAAATFHMTSVNTAFCRCDRESGM